MNRLPVLLKMLSQHVSLTSPQQFLIGELNRIHLPHLDCKNHQCPALVIFY